MGAFRYHLISNRNLYAGSLLQFASEAENAGVHEFQLREKDLSPSKLFELAVDLRSVLRRTLLIINGQLDVALASGADGVHLQNHNVPVDVVRSRFPSLRIGYSAHSEQEMIQAQEEGADYVLISPVFAPVSKPLNEGLLDLEEASSWVRALRIPVLALGGITAANIMVLKDKGFSGAAGISLFLDQGQFTSKGMVI